MATHTADEKAIHYLHSTLREKIVEHVFVGLALQRLWQLGVTNVEVLRSEFDAGGYDLVMSRGNIIRHIQLKSSMVDGKTARISASLKLAEKPSGCIIWIKVNDQLEIETYGWFGGEPGKELRDIRNMKTAKHTRGDKAYRPGQRIIPIHKFKFDPSLDILLSKLLGPLQ